MFKKILLAIAIAIPAMGFAQSKFGVVDAQAVLQQMPEYKTAEEQLQTSQKTYQDEHAKLVEELTKKEQELNALAADTPQAILERRQQELRELYQRIEAFGQNAQQDLARQEQTLIAPIQEKLLNAIKAVGAEQGYSMILPDGVAFYTGTDVINVTDAVKSKLGIQ